MGEQAKGYADDNPRVPLITVESPATGDIAVAMDERHDTLVISIDITRTLVRATSGLEKTSRKFC